MGRARRRLVAPLHHCAKLKPIAVNAKLAVAVHALDDELDALGVKAVARMLGHGHAVNHARRPSKDASCVIESSTVLSLPVRKWTRSKIESLFQLYTWLYSCLVSCKARCHTKAPRFAKREGP